MLQSFWLSEMLALAVRPFSAILLTLFLVHPVDAIIFNKIHMLMSTYLYQANFKADNWYITELFILIVIPTSPHTNETVQTQTEGSSYHWVIRYVGKPVECCPQSPVEIILQTLVSLNSRGMIVSWWVCVLKLNITSRLNKTSSISWHFFSAVGVKNVVIWLVEWWHTLDSQNMVAANLPISNCV